MRRTASITFALATALTAAAAAENWPQWRGPHGQGISTETQLPVEWAPARNVAWKTPLPHGYSSPIVWEDRIFLTSAIEGEVVPGVVPESAKFASEVMRARTRFHTDQARRHLREHRQQVAPSDASPEQHLAIPPDPMHTEYILRQVDTDSGNVHFDSSSP